MINFRVDSDLFIRNGGDIDLTDVNKYMYWERKSANMRLKF